MAVVDDIKVKLEALADDLDKGFEAAASKMQKLGQRLSDAGAKLSQTVTLPILGIGIGALKTSGDFEAAMNRVGAKSGAVGGEFTALSGLAKKLGADTSFSGTQAAEGMEVLASAGFNVNEIMTATPAVLQLAATEGMGLADAAGIASGILRGFGKDTSELNGIVDVLAKTSVETNSSVQDLGLAFSYAGPVAKGAGQDFNQMAAVLGILANNGFAGERAGTALRFALSALIDPTSTANEEAKKLGVSIFDTHGKMLPFKDILQQISEKADPAATAVRIFGTEAGPAMAALVQTGTGAITALEGQLKSAGGTAKELADVQMKGFNGSVEALSGSVEGLGIAIGEAGLLDWMTSLVQTVTDGVNWIAQINPLFLAMGTVIAGVAAAVGPVLWALGTLITMFGPTGSLIVGLKAVGTAFSLFWSVPAGIIVAAVVAGVALVIAYWDDLTGAAETMANKLGFSFREVADGWNRLSDDVKRWWNSSKITAEENARMIADAEQKLKDAIKRARAGGTEAVEKFSGAVAAEGRKVQGATIGIGSAFAGARSKVEGEVQKTAGAVERHIGARVPDAADRARERFRETINGLALDTAAAMAALEAEVSDAAPELAAAGSDLARSIVDSYGVDLADLSDKTKVELGLATRELTNQQAAWQELGGKLADSVIEGIFEGTEDGVGLSGLRAEAVKAIEDSTAGMETALEKNLGTSGSLRRIVGKFVEDFKDNFGSLSDKVHEVSQSIADDLWNGEFSVKKVFEDLGKSLYSAVVTTIIEGILNLLIDKIIEIYNAMRGNSLGPTGAPGGGLTKPGGPGDGGDGGGDGGGVGFPIHAKGLAPAVEEFTRKSGDRAVSIAFSALSQGLSKMVLNFGDYGSAAAKHYLDQLFGPNGTLRNVPGFSEIEFPDIFDVIKWFLGNWGDWLPGGGGGGWGPGGPGGWKPGGGLTAPIGGVLAAGDAPIMVTISGGDLVELVRTGMVRIGRRNGTSGVV